MTAPLLTPPGLATPGPVGLVGLGLVGNALARRLAAHGFSVWGHDTITEARKAFKAKGFETADSIAQLAQRSTCMLLAVFDSQGVLDVVEGPNGLLANGWGQPAQAEAPACQIIDCSTGSPDLLAALAARLQLRGIDFIEAPLSGSSHQIAAGEATLLLGGEGQAIERANRVLGAIASARFHMGGAGMGAKAKLATNLVLGLNRAALAEGMVFARALGIAPAAFLQLVQNSPANSGAAQAKGDLMVQTLSGIAVPAQSRIRQHLKDVDLMLAAASARNQALPLSETHASLMRSAIQAGDGDLDNAAIVRQIMRATKP
jgi:3-hydroxyisobutyrate dehydrogenase-like beta-hydroxyacid dehydrogenase